MQIKHLVDTYREGRCDSVWVPNLAREGGWIIITADKGKDRSKPDIRELCREYKITCVAMTDTLQKQGTAKHMEVLHEVLRNIEPIYRAPAGTVVTIGYRQDKGGIVRFEFSIKRPPQSPISLGAFLAIQEAAKPKGPFTGELGL